MTSLMITVLGTPRPKQSVRRFKGKWAPVAHKGSHLKAWTDALVAEAAQLPHIHSNSPPAVQDLARRIYTEPCLIDMRFCMPTKKAERWGRPHAGVPDEDNLRKAVKDALKKAGVVRDDSTIVGGYTEKLWSKHGGVVLKLRLYDAPGAQAFCRTCP